MSKQDAFFALLRAGLWEKEVRLSPSDIIDFKDVYRLAEEQSVVGLVAAGLEHVKDYRVPQNVLLVFAGSALQVERCNVSMNRFIERLSNTLNGAGIKFRLVKGQGVSQCYERPLWRTCGDVDLLLDEENYEKAKQLLSPLADIIENEDTDKLHVGFSIKSWTVELHGTLHGAWSKRVDNVIDEVQYDTCHKDGVRVWKNGKVNIFLPSPDNDVVLVFAHILQHFFKGGVGLRQVCDWCRLIWTYRSEINAERLERRLQLMGLESEWKAFASLAVQTLGMNEEVMPLYSKKRIYKRKSEKICSNILEYGNMGHNKDLSYQLRYKPIWRKIRTIGVYTNRCLKQSVIFPKDTFLVWWNMTKNGIKNFN